MAGETEVQKFYQPKFTTEIALLSQQMVGKLRPTMTFNADYKGESGEAVKQIGIIEANYGDETDGGRTPDNSAPRDQRWVFPAEANVGKLFKRADALRILADTSAAERSAMVAGMNRAEDRKVIMPAFFGPAKTGKAGATTTNFDDANQKLSINIGSADGATAIGANTAKLIKAREILSLGDVDMDADELWVAFTAKQMTDMLNDIKATNRDYNGGDPVLKDGRLKYWMGFNFVELNGIPTDPADATIRWNPMWAKSGMHLGVWEELQTFTGPDSGRKFNTWLYMEQMKAATRLEEKKVVKIPCKES